MNWICTDPDAGQYLLKDFEANRKGIYTFKEKGIVKEIDLHKFTAEQQIYAIGFFGHAPSDIWNLPEAIIAEYIFELNMEADIVLTKSNVVFSHIHVEGFGWENTVRVFEDYDKVKILCIFPKYVIFKGYFENLKPDILKGYINYTNEK